MGLFYAFFLKKKRKTESVRAGNLFASAKSNLLRHLPTVSYSNSLFYLMLLAS